MDLRTSTPQKAREQAPLTIRRVDAIPVALPLAKPVAMAGSTVRDAHNILVRIEAGDGTVGWGEAASAPTMTGDTLGGLTAAVRDHLAPLLIGTDAWQRDALAMKLRRALIGNTGAHSAIEMALLDLAGRAAEPAAGRSGRRRAALRGRADVAAWQSDARRRHRRGAQEARRGLRLLQAQDRHQAGRDRNRRHLGAARGTRTRACRSAPTPIAA